MTKDLDGLQVVTLEQAVAAPYASGKLAQAGARVIKVEREEGDFARNYDNDDYGALSVLFGLFTESKIQFDVSKNCFYPPPKITSSVITIQRESLVDQEVRLDAFEISKVAFQQRRKKVRTSLSSIISEGQLEELDIDINSRAGNLSPDDYLKIAKARQ